MKILTRSTVFRTAALAGLFSLMLAFGGVFFGITASVHAVTAGEVGTDEMNLKEFVESAIEEYYIGFFLKKHCDLEKLDLPKLLEDNLAVSLQSIGLNITDLSQDSIKTLTTEEVRRLLNLFEDPATQAILGPDFDMWGGCRPLPPDSTFRDVFTASGAEGSWLSGSIYLFVMDHNKKLLFHGSDEKLDGVVLEAIDGGGRDVGRLLVDEVSSTADGDGLVDYCWNDPAITEDDVVDDDPATAPGDSWKTSYVVDPFEYLGVDPPSGSSSVIFGSGIYPKTGTPPEGCMIYGEEPPTTTPPTTPPTTGGGDSGGGGCAIAAGSGGTPKGVAFNLLLIASALFFTVSLAGRAGGRRNGIPS